MRCPKCKNRTLKPTRLEQGLPVMACNHCGGSLVSLLYYRDWLERKGSHLDASAGEDAIDISESHAALNCPKCGRVMTKYAISGEVDNRLDLCSSCDEAWLDGGEWMQMKQLRLGGAMPKVFTEAWQSRVHKDRLEGNRRKRLENRIGAENLETVEKFRQWLANQPHKADIIFYLGQK